MPFQVLIVSLFYVAVEDLRGVADSVSPVESPFAAEDDDVRSVVTFDVFLDSAFISKPEMVRDDLLGERN